MSRRSDKMYSKEKQPKLERDEESGKMEVKKGMGTKKADEIEAGTDGAIREKSEDKKGEGIPAHARHGIERMEMHTKHQNEHHAHDHGEHGDKEEMHARHEKEMKVMHTRHEKELKDGGMDAPKKSEREEEKHTGEKE